MRIAWHRIHPYWCLIMWMEKLFCTKRPQLDISDDATYQRCCNIITIDPMRMLDWCWWADKLTLHWRKVSEARWITLHCQIYVWQHFSIKDGRPSVRAWKTFDLQIKHDYRKKKTTTIMVDDIQKKTWKPISILLDRGWEPPRKNGHSKMDFVSVSDTDMMRTNVSTCQTRHTLSLQIKL